MKKNLLVFLFLFSSIVFSQDLPEAIGLVNDFADIIDNDIEAQLEQRLSTYEENSSIEIAVVTVNSLEGMVIEDYSIRLAEKWKVGKSELDNGVILLVAPNERKVRIEVGYGLEPDFTDSRSSRIIQGVITPAFRDGDMSGGIVAGVEAIIAGLGEIPFEQRLEERRLAEEERQRQIAAMKAFLLQLAAWFILVAIGLSPIVLIVLVYRKIQALKRIQEDNKKELSNLMVSMHDMKNKFDGSGQRVVSALSEEFNNNEWHESFNKCKEELLGFMEKGEEIQDLLEEKRSWMRAEDYRFDIEGLRTHLSHPKKLLTTSDSVLNNLRSRRDNWPHQLEEFHDIFDDVEKLSNHPDVHGIEKDALAARKHIGNAIKTVAQAKGNSAQVDWIQVSWIAASAIDAIKQVKDKANEDIAYAKKARKEGPELLNSLPEEIDDAKDVLGKNYVSKAAKEFYKEAKEFYKQAADLATRKSCDWVLVFIALNQAKINLEAALEQAKRDKPKPRPKRRRSSYSSSPVIVGGGWSSGGSSGGGFGGFGGGSFGGGGATGSW